MSNFVTGEIVEVNNGWFDTATYALITIGEVEYKFCGSVLALGFKNGELDEEGCLAEEFTRLGLTERNKLDRLLAALNKRDPNIKINLSGVTCNIKF